MLKSVRAQIDRVRQDYRDLEVNSQLGYLRIVIKNFPLPKHWGKEKANLRVTLPPGYPQEMPTNFSIQLYDQYWKDCCFRPSHWNPVEDNLLKWIKLIEKFLKENHP